MFRNLKPSTRVHQITDIDIAALHALGYRHYIVDVDNTLCTRQELRVQTRIVQSLRLWRDEGFIEDIVLLSNIGLRSERMRRRIDEIAASLQIKHSICAYWPKIKPNPAPFVEAMSLMGAKSETTVMIGDQLFSDVLGGNRLGMYTILVEPLGDDHWITLGKRLLEKIVLCFQ